MHPYKMQHVVVNMYLKLFELSCFFILKQLLVFLINKNNISVLFPGTAVLALLLAGYFGQKYLPPPRPKIVGIDLGIRLFVETQFL